MHYIHIRMYFTYIDSVDPVRESESNQVKSDLLLQFVAKGTKRWGFFYVLCTREFRDFSGSLLYRSIVFSLGFDYLHVGF